MQRSSTVPSSSSPPVGGRSTSTFHHHHQHNGNPNTPAETYGFTVPYDRYNALVADHMRLRDELSRKREQCAQLQSEQLETVRKEQEMEQMLARQRMEVMASRAQASSIHASFEDVCLRYRALHGRFKTVNAELVLERAEHERLAGEVVTLQERVAGLEAVS